MSALGRNQQIHGEHRHDTPRSANIFAPVLWLASILLWTLIICGVCAVALVLL